MIPNCVQDCSATRCPCTLQGKAERMSSGPHPKKKLDSEQHGSLLIWVPVLCLGGGSNATIFTCWQTSSCEHTSRNVLLACPGLSYWAPTWEYSQKNGKRNPFLLNLWRGKSDCNFSKWSFFKLTSFTILAVWPRVEGKFNSKSSYLLFLLNRS